jgi:hypothetical protein
VRFVERVGAALVAPRAALAQAETGYGGLADAALLLALKVVCIETPSLIAALWSFVLVGPGLALRALLARLSEAIGVDLVLLVAGGALVTLAAGARRNPARDFDLAAVAWTPVLAVDTFGTLVARVAGVTLGGPVPVLWLAALGWMGALLALATSRARGRA